MRWPTKKEGYLYFVRQIGGVGPIKIGFSDLVWLRIPMLSSASPVPLELVLAVWTEARYERLIQNSLLSTHSHHEWFHPSEKLMKLIDDLRSGASIEKATHGFHPEGSILVEIRKVKRKHGTSQEQLLDRCRIKAEDFPEAAQ